MNAKDAIRQSMNMAEMLLNTYIGDLSDNEILIQPIAGMNHIAWQLGHLISVERDLTENIKSGSSPELPAGFAAAHSQGESKGTNPEDFLDKATYLSLYNAQRAVTLEVLNDLPDADLDKPTTDEHLVNIAPTYGAVLNLIGLHYLMHLGQFVAVRRSLNKPVTI